MVDYIVGLTTNIFFKCGASYHHIAIPDIFVFFFLITRVNWSMDFQNGIICKLLIFY